MRRALTLELHGCGRPLWVLRLLLLQLLLAGGVVLRLRLRLQRRLQLRPAQPARHALLRLLRLTREPGGRHALLLRRLHLQHPRKRLSGEGAAGGGHSARGPHHGR